MTAWTQFHDMHSGGGIKEPPYHHIFIEAPQAEAERIFYERFGHNPNRVTCTCCGEDYSITESETLEQATAYLRRLTWARPEDDLRGGRYLEPDEPMPAGWVDSGSSFSSGPPQTMEQFIAERVDNDPADWDGRVLLVRAADISDAERSASEPPEQGYVWVGGA